MAEVVNYESSEDAARARKLCRRDQKVSGVSCCFVFFTEVVKFPGLRFSFSSVSGVWLLGLGHQVTELLLTAAPAKILMIFRHFFFFYSIVSIVSILAAAGCID